MSSLMSRIHKRVIKTRKAITGKTIKRIYMHEWRNYMIFVFTDKTFAVLQTEESDCGDDREAIYIDKQPSLKTLLDAGLVTQNDYDREHEQDKKNDAKAEERYERQEYERLKGKYEK